MAPAMLEEPAAARIITTARGSRARTASTEETGQIPVPWLKEFWSRKSANSGEGAHWVADNTLLSGLRVGLRETYDLLLQGESSLAEFEQWILVKNGGAIDAARIERPNRGFPRRAFRANRSMPPRIRC